MRGHARKMTRAKNKVAIVEKLNYFARKLMDFEKINTRIKGTFLDG